MATNRRQNNSSRPRKKFKEVSSRKEPQCTALQTTVVSSFKPYGALSRRRFLQWNAGLMALLGYSLIGPRWETKKVSAENAQPVADPVYRNQITHADRMAAAKNASDMLSASGLVKESFSAVNPGPGDVPDYYSLTVPNWAWTPPLRKFVDGLPGLGLANANGLGQYIPIAVPDTISYPGSDYYEIELQEYDEQMHSDLPPTRMRGYVQTNNGTDQQNANTIAPAPIHYMGPLIIARRDRAVRVRFTNALPIGAGGNLFIPVDSEMMGASIGPMGGVEKYTHNRAVIHLHGADAPWISDGTPHQWITPAGETTSYPEGASVFYSGVPDMPVPGPGQYNYYYPNQMSARFLFYHDHALGITRLNVYAGMAAGYLIQDDVEDELVDAGLIPAEQIPLVIQDRTYVDADMLPDTDPTWEWGITPPTPHTGDLWMGHVYTPAQHPWAPDGSGVNPMGRWHYAPWFWPPATDLEVGPQPNPYYDPINEPWQGPEIPGTPHPAMQMESFQDSMIVNGTVFPYLEVDPKAYRFRILNASNDRFINLQIYEADPDGYAIDANGDSVTPGTGFGTEVKMVSAANYPDDPTWPQDFEEGNGTWPVDGREGGVPDWNLAGPDWIAIGSEGGFLPAPAVVRQRPIDWNVDVTMFNAGLVNSFSLLLGPAERSDVIVDFSAYAGKTLIVYNDAPAPFPAPDPRFDFYTGSPDMAEAGGYTYPANSHTTLPGHGPNTRTVMQIRVHDVAPDAPFDLPALEEAWESNQNHQGVFERTQPPVIVPQARYNSAYNANFPTDAFVRIFQSSFTFQTLSGATMTIPLQPKAIQDEMGEAYDPVYGRMSGMLGLELPQTKAGAQNFMLYPYASPPVELIHTSMVPLSEPLPGDGTQIWKITHNGVDTHPIHFHLFNVQLINRVAWDGFLSFPHATELGWKETVRVSPLEDTIVALRPVAPQLPFKVPNSIRPIDATMPLGEVLTGPPGGFADPAGNPVTVVNQMVNFGWEYVIHCHILGHEEMDMMHGVAFLVPPDPPINLIATTLSSPTRISLVWTDDSANATGFRLERATDQNFTTNVTSVTLGYTTNYEDTTINEAVTYYYRVFARNTVGSTVPGFPQATAESEPSNVATQSSGVAQTRVITASPNSLSPAETLNMTAVVNLLPGVTPIASAGLPVVFSYVFYKLDSATTQYGTVNALTNGSGVASLALPVPNEKTTIVVDAIFNGDANLLASSNMVTVAVVPFIESRITASSSGGLINFHLADQYGVPMFGRNISFLTTSGSLSVPSAITDVNGDVSVTLSGTGAGVVSASFGGWVSPAGWSYQPAQTRITAELVASGLAQTRVITSAPNSVSPSETLTMTASVSQLPGPVPVIAAGLTIVFNYVIHKLDSATTETGSLNALTDGSGVAVINVPAPAEKATFVLDAIFNGNGSLLPSSAMKIVAVVPFIESRITASSSGGLITFHLEDQYGNSMAGHTLTFLTTSGTLSAASGVTTGSGDTAVTLSGTSAGVVSGSFGGYVNPSGWSYQPAQARITVLV
ncbi:MAG: multicopper oxidase domain-containing protein [Dehalococcoidaceae bacterium]|nr:multicopper oxidase domain-containing protein [Dehalococcoidaceae bacterium]